MRRLSTKLLLLKSLSSYGILYMKQNYTTGDQQEMNNQSIMGIICSSYEQFFDAEKRIADYILENKKSVVDMTVAQLAKASGTSDATVSRFCRPLGGLCGAEVVVAVVVAVVCLQSP